jgi:hypothetical protein
MTQSPSPKPGTSTALADARSALMDSIRHLALDAHFSRATLKAAEAVASSDSGWRGPVAWFRPEGSHAEAWSFCIGVAPTIR